MVVDDLAIGVGEAQRSHVARLEGIDAIGRILCHVTGIVDRIVHHDQAASST